MKKHSSKKKALLIALAVIVVLMSFLKVEKHIKEDQKTILENQKAAVLAAGGECDCGAAVCGNDG